MQQKLEKLNAVRDTLYAPEAAQAKLSSPKSRRDEIKKVRDEMEQYKEFKKQQMFLGKRERIIKGGWRHGILGIDDADSGKT